jgi:hypothetical protein
MSSAQRVAAKPDAAAAGADAAVGVIAEVAANALSQPNAESALNQPNAANQPSAANASSYPNAENAKHKQNMQLEPSVPNLAARPKPKCRSPRGQHCQRKVSRSGFRRLPQPRLFTPQRPKCRFLSPPRNPFSYPSRQQRRRPFMSNPNQRRYCSRSVPSRLHGPRLPSTWSKHCRKAVW